MEITLENGLLKVGVKQKGAELFSVVTKNNGLDYIWSGDPAFWGKTSPVLFPIVGTLKDDTFLYQDKTYKLPRHGFARDSIFEIEMQQQDRVTFLLKNNDTTLEKYPFPFELRLTYELKENVLVVLYQVNNTGKEDMYFSIGAHPAFQVPMVEKTRYEDHYLEFNEIENTGRWPLSKGGLLESTSVRLLTNTKKLPLTRELFYADAVVLKNLRSTCVSLKSDKHAHGLDFHFDGFPFMGIWAAKDADFVCIEPWCGVADSVTHNQQLISKEGIEKLNGGKNWARSWNVKFY